VAGVDQHFPPLTMIGPCIRIRIGKSVTTKRRDFPSEEFPDKLVGHFC
jgi:hypothetical protein